MSRTPEEWHDEMARLCIVQGHRERWEDPCTACVCSVLLDAIEEAKSEERRACSILAEDWRIRQGRATAPHAEEVGP